MVKLREVVEDYMSRTTGLGKFCDRCLRTERWGGNVVLMVVDAAFDSIGLNYFNSVVPKVTEFEETFVEDGKVRSLEDLSNLPLDRVAGVWRNERSWNVTRSVASYLRELGEREGLGDREAFRRWAADSRLEDWKLDPIGKIRGIGITTYQYLRMMGGVDTAMPDKVVRRVIEEVLHKADVKMPTKGDVELVHTIDRIASITGYRPIEICWMTWLIQPEGDATRMEKHRGILDRI